MQRPKLLMKTEKILPLLISNSEIQWLPPEHFIGAVYMLFTGIRSSFSGSHEFFTSFSKVTTHTKQQQLKGKWNSRWNVLLAYRELVLI